VRGDSLKKLSSALLVVLGLVLALSPVLSVSAAATTLPTHMEFSNLAVGPCLIGGVNGGSTPWFSYGTGSTALGGSANDVSISSSATGGFLPGPCYVADIKSSVGALLVSWRENDVPNRLAIIIYAVPTSQIYDWVNSPTENVYQAGVQGPGMAVAPTEMNFQGIYTIGSSTQQISGYITDSGASGETSSFVWLLFTFGNQLMTVMWSGQPGLINWGYSIPVATIFSSNVWTN
jgi:hypothetical protein